MLFFNLYLRTNKLGWFIVRKLAPFAGIINTALNQPSSQNSDMPPLLCCGSLTVVSIKGSAEKELLNVCIDIIQRDKIVLGSDSGCDFVIPFNFIGER
jgi:hypothetical protein